MTMGSKIDGGGEGAHPPDEKEQVGTLIEILSRSYEINAETTAMNSSILAVTDDLIRLGELAVEPLLILLHDQKGTQDTSSWAASCLRRTAACQSRSS
jgi:hypothetical protein